MYRYLLALIVYAFIILVEAEIDQDDASDTPSTTSMDECRGYCDRLSGYYCVEFLGICVPCIQSDCQAHHKSVCPSICEEYFKGQLSTSPSPGRTSSKAPNSASPDHPRDMLVITKNSRSSNQLADENRQKRLLLVYIFIITTVTSVIIVMIVLLIRVFIGPGTLSLLTGDGRGRGRGRSGAGFRSVSSDSEMKVSSKLAPDNLYVALPGQRVYTPL